MGKRKTMENEERIQYINYSATKRYGMYILQHDDKNFMGMLLGVIEGTDMMIFYNDATRSVLLYDKYHMIGKYKATYNDIRAHRLSNISTMMSCFSSFMWVPEISYEYIVDACRTCNCYLVPLHNISKKILLDTDMCM